MITFEYRDVYWEVKATGTAEQIEQAMLVADDLRAFTEPTHAPVD